MVFLINVKLCHFLRIPTNDYSVKVLVLTVLTISGKGSTSLYTTVEYFGEVGQIVRPAIKVSKSASSGDEHQRELSAGSCLSRSCDAIILAST